MARNVYGSRRSNLLRRLSYPHDMPWNCCQQSLLFRIEKTVQNRNDNRCFCLAHSNCTAVIFEDHIILSPASGRIRSRNRRWCCRCRSQYICGNTLQGKGDELPPCILGYRNACRSFSAFIFLLPWYFMENGIHLSRIDTDGGIRHHPCNSSHLEKSHG